MIPRRPIILQSTSYGPSRGPVPQRRIRALTSMRTSRSRACRPCLLRRPGGRLRPGGAACRGARDPGGRHRPGVREARRAAAAPAGAGAPGGHARRGLPHARAPATSTWTSARPVPAARRPSSGSATTCGSTRTARGSERRRIAAARVSLPSDRSFAAWDDALAHVTGPPLAGDTELAPDQALAGRAARVSPSPRPASGFSMRPALAHLGIRTLRRAPLPAPGGERARLPVQGDPGLVRLDPRWYQAALSFVRLGFGHILGGIDHLLFVLCLVIPLRRLRGLLPVVTAFTVAHSITLVASALGLAPDAALVPAAGRDAHRRCPSCGWRSRTSWGPAWSGAG